MKKPIKSKSQVQLAALAPLRVALVSTYIPKRCGIASFTKDLADNLNILNPDRLVEIIAVDSEENKTLKYPWEVSKIIKKDHLPDYIAMADYLNQSIIDVVVIQHEYGIFGGSNGDYILELTSRLKKPFVVVLHTILQNPSEEQKNILQILNQKAKQFITMLPVASELLEEIYQIPSQKITTIPHGTPDFSFLGNPNELKQQFKVKNKIVMSSINLVDPNKGFEYVIQALPQVAKQYPNFIYLLVGQTHPEVLRRHGEQYRQKLEQLVKDLKLTKNVRFVNEYVSKPDLIKYLNVSDFYITPYLNTEQISSGSLAYAIAAGKLCLSTPYRYALETLSGGKGYIVQPRTSQEITQAILHALANPDEALQIRQKCYNSGRKMTWTRVAYSYLEVFIKAARPKELRAEITRPKLDHLSRLTDRIGMLEHSGPQKIKYEEGYSSDDNARALIVAIKHKNYALARRYLQYLEKSESKGRIYCDMNADGKFINQADIKDYFGRTVWATCYTWQYGTPALQQRAKQLLSKLLPNIQDKMLLRPKSFCLIGLCSLDEEKLAAFKLTKLRDQLAQDLIKGFEKQRTQNWIWFEDKMTYDNGRLPQALLMYSDKTGDSVSQSVGLATLNFLVDKTFDLRDNCFHFIGSDGWLAKDQEKATNNQQPIEAGTTTEALVTAYLVTNKHYYLEMAQNSFSWYFGNNIQRTKMFNAKRQSVYDGLDKMDRGYQVNLNQGAEAILSYQLGFFALRRAILSKKRTKHHLNFYAPHHLAKIRQPSRHLKQLQKILRFNPRHYAILVAIFGLISLVGRV